MIDDDVLFVLLLVDELADEELEVLVLRGARVLSESDTCIEASLFSGSIIGKGIVIDDAKIVLPWEAFCLSVEVRTDRVGKVLLTQLVDSRHFLIIRVFFIKL